ncbi:MAG: metal-dependent hydrolase [Candidatus Woesearchaeota archaeon]
MPFAVTHALTSIVSADLYRDYVTKHKKHFTLFTILVAGIAGMLPDIDIPISLILTKLGYQIPLLFHRGFTHTLFFALLFLIPGIILWFNKNKYKKWAILFFVASFGIGTHILLDYLISSTETLMLFWPFSVRTYGLNWISSEAIINVYAAIDAILLLAWLAHEEIKHKIKDFI